jgi:trimethylamine--corrinoid protein Co-methyltransferase
MDMPTEDVSGNDAYVRVMETFAVNTIKPVMAGPSSHDSLMRWIELAEILANGRRLSECPMIALGAPVTTPLTFNGINAEIMKEGVRRGLPICAQTEPIAGITAPLSFAGGLLVGNCENLFLVTMAQLIRQGAPIAYSIGNALMDFQTGRAIFYPADKMLWKIASSQMAEFYHLPIEGEATGSMVGRCDTQNGIEHALHMLPSVICGGGMYNGMGSCYNACGMSAEMIVIHSDLQRLIERLRKGIDLSDRMLDVESILKVGSGGHFMEEDLTIEMLRSGEFYTTGCFDRTGEQSANRFEDSLLFRAHKRVEELVSSHKPAVPANVVHEIHRWADGKCG